MICFEKGRTMSIKYCLVILLVLASTCACADEIKYRKKGSSEIGVKEDVVIERETYREVQFLLKGSRSARMRLPISEVVEISYKDTPYEYKTGEQLFSAGNYKTALKSYLRLRNTKGPLQQHCLFKAALCYQNMRVYSRALKLYTGLVNTNPDTRHLLEAQFNMAECFLRLSRPNRGKAYAAYRRASSVAREIGDVARQLQALYEMGRLQERGGKLDTSIQHYDEMSRNAREYPDWLYRAQVRKAHCLLRKKEHEDAKTILLDLSKQVPEKSRPIWGGIYTGLGHYWSLRNDKQKALLCYLRVIFRYSDEDEYAESAYKHAASCLEELEKQLLFSLSSGYRTTLDREEISDELRREFAGKKSSLSYRAAIKTQKKGKNWVIEDPEQPFQYAVEYTGRDLRVYRHYPQYRGQAQQMRAYLRERYGS